MEVAEVYVPHAGWLSHEREDEVARFLAEGWFEYREQAFLWLYLRPGDVFLDCGAHVGLYSVVAGRAMGGRGAVIAVEPHPESASLLEQNLRANQIECGRVLRLAILSRPGTAGFHAGPAGKAAYSGLSAVPDGRAEVPVDGTSLDALLEDEEIAAVHVAKIDIEGAELDALRGASESIRQARLPLLIIENTEANLQRFGRDTRALFDALGEAGYTVCRFDPKTCRLVPRPYEGVIWYDNLFAVQRLAEVNARLAQATEAAGGPQSRIARDILTRGELCDRLYGAAMDFNKTLEATERRADDARAEARESERRAGEERRIAANLATELQLRLEELARSRYLQAGWKLGLAKRPAWIDGNGSARPVLQADAAPAENGRQPSAAESEMRRALEHLRKKRLRPDVVLDIGAGRGYWSMMAREYFLDAEFYLLEPLAETEPNLRELCRKDSRQHYVLTAVGSEVGTKVMNMGVELESSTMLSFPGPDPARQRSLPVTTVDKLLEEGLIRPPQLVKIDVQGMELQVLQGGQKLFETAEVFIVEVNLFVYMDDCPRVHDIVRHMGERGFHLFDLAGSLRRPFEDDLGQLDLVMVSGRSPLVASNRWV